MSSLQEIKGKVAQVTPVITGEGDTDNIKMSKLGAIWTADWQAQLAAAGLCYSAHIGTLTTGADVGLIVGGGNGTTVDTDQPELLLGVDAGYYLIPLELHVICDMDVDTDGEYGEILFFADRSQAPPTTAVGTPGVVTPNNQLDGGAAFPGRCYGGVTTNLTAPVMSEFIDLSYVNASEFVSNGSATNLTNGIVHALRMDWYAKRPKILAGACELCVAFGGTAAVNGMINIEFACVPSSYFPVV